MYQKLKKKIIFIEMTAFLIVTILILGIINIVLSYQANQTNTRLLNMISNNSGKFPYVNKNDDNKLAFGGKITQETQYTTRYFIVNTDEEGNIEESDLGHIAEVSSGELPDIVKSVLNKDNEEGSYLHYKYKVVEKNGGYTLYFVDNYTQTLFIKYVMKISIFIAIIAMIVVFIIVYLLSGKAIEPILRNFEKQKRFITDAGHELKTPLAAISANADVLTLTVGKNDSINRIKKQTRQLNALIQEMLTLAKLEDYEKKSEFSKVDLSLLMKDVILELEPIAENSNKKLLINIEDDICIFGDNFGLQHLISVLLDNAIKYCTDKGTITARLSRSGKKILMEIRNTGNVDGVEDLNRLFDRFYRADKSRSKATGGFGIGLSIAKAVVENHHGEISVQNNNGEVSFLVQFKE